MKVIQVGPKSIHVASFTNAMSKEVSEQIIVTEEHSDYDGFLSNYEVSFYGFSPFVIIKNYVRLKKIIRQESPNLIHIHQVNRMAYFTSRIASKLGIPIITTAWGSDVLLMPNKNVLYRWLVRSTLRKSMVITGDSQHMISEMNQLENKSDKYQCIQYGIDPVIPAVKENIIYSNRFLLPLYRIHAILNYFIEFSKSNPTWKLVIASTGFQKEELESKVAEMDLSDKVEFIGWQESEQNRDWYAKSMIYTSIPESDGTSVSVLEAISANCIPVLSDIPVSKEWVVDGVNGVIESKGQNPFESALKLNWDKAIQKNSELIKNSAIRSASILKFKAIYTQYGSK